MASPRSPAVVRMERVLGYLNGSRQAVMYAEGVDVLAVLDLIARLHPYERNTPYGQGYIGGIVALWCGVSLFPIPDATSIKPYSSVMEAFRLSNYYG